MEGTHTHTHTYTRRYVVNAVRVPQNAWRCVERTMRSVGMLAMASGISLSRLSWRSSHSSCGNCVESFDKYKDARAIGFD